MTVITGGRKSIVKKLSPSGQLVLAWRPRPYPLTAQQRKIGDAARACGIKRGSKPTAEQFSCIRSKFR